MYWLRLLFCTCFICWGLYGFNFCCLVLLLIAWTCLFSCFACCFVLVLILPCGFACCLVVWNLGACYWLCALFVYFAINTFGFLLLTFVVMWCLCLVVGLRDYLLFWVWLTCFGGFWFTCCVYCLFVNCLLCVLFDLFVV